MIVFVYGTTAEAIKLGPVIRRLVSQGVQVEQWVTFQQARTVFASIGELGLPEPAEVLAMGARGRPLAGVLDAVIWSFSIAGWLSKNGRRLRRRLAASQSIVVVHGDTMTSVVGSLIGKALRTPVAHVEAGLRSGNWRHPFPEELDRRVVGRLAHIHYAPSQAAVAALSGRKNVVWTHGNTATDALLEHDTTYNRASQHPFGLVLLHRFEFLNNRILVSNTIAQLLEHAPIALHFVVDDHASGAIVPEIAKHANSRTPVTVTGKLQHSEFVELVASAQFIVTDSGGLQEEASVLGTPTLLHRRATERDDGIGRNVILSGWSGKVMGGFLENYDTYRHPMQSLIDSPSDIVVRDLLERGYGG
jgi:UDP-N-acetylglucosamine 2-epimerase (non-hydrolysing)